MASSDIHAPIELADATRNLTQLLEELAGSPPDWNEADTRMHLIDRLIIECLGWPRSDLHLERAQGREYSDYELGSPVAAIWEAKRAGKLFEIPVRKPASTIHSIASIMAISPVAKEAIEQVNGYCVNRGVEVAVATNGQQIVAFIADKNLTSSSKSKCFVVSSLDQLQTVLPRLWQLLSPAGIEASNLSDLLQRSALPKPPEKLSASIPSYPQLRQPNDLQRSLLDMAELLLLNVDDQPELERQFYVDCYCESGALSQHALVSKQMLNARYASLFPDAEDLPQPIPVTSQKNKAQLTPAVLADAISNRPIALVGDVGVGKSSFLKHLMYVSAYEEFQYALYAYVNLGRKGALAQSISELVLDQIEEALLTNYDIDISEASFVKSVYKSDIKRFDRSVYGDYKNTNPDKYTDKLLDMLSSKQENRSEHLRRSIDYLAKEKRKQIIVAIDNADQRNYDVQQEAFVIAQNLAAEWNATVFISIRPKTFYLSKRSGALSAYPHRVFTVAPPRIDHVIEKRLVFALNIAEGNVQMEKLRAINFQLGNIATFIRVLLASIDRHDDVKVFLENITGGNIRELIQFISGMFGNPNVDLQGAIIALEEDGNYTLPVHELWKVALKGDSAYFDPERAMAASLFDVATNDAVEHFAMPILLSLLNTGGSHRNSEGFVEYVHIVSELQNVGIKPGTTDAIVKRANNKKLIEAPDRITFEEDDAGIYGSMPSRFRINTTGVYHLDVWMTSFPYLDAVCVDTPIFDPTFSDSLRSTIRSFSLKDRYERALMFRDYLSSVWVQIPQPPSYFDWEAACQANQDGFNRVKAALARRFRG